MAAGPLTTLAKVRAFLGLADAATDADAVLETWVTNMSVWAQTTRMQRVITLSSYSRTFMGNGLSSFAFPESPAQSVVSVVVGSRTLTFNTDYFWDETKIQLMPGVCFDKFVKCQVNWTAGFLTVPADLEQAATELVAMVYKERDRLGEMSKTLGGAETVSFDTAPGTKRALAVLDAYRRTFVAGP